MFITLHLWSDGSRYDPVENTILFAVDKITAILPTSERKNGEIVHHSTAVHFDGKCRSVIETPEEIMKLIAECPVSPLDENSESRILGERVHSVINTINELKASRGALYHSEGSHIYRIMVTHFPNLEAEPASPPDPPSPPEPGVDSLLKTIDGLTPGPVDTVTIPLLFNLIDRLLSREDDERRSRMMEDDLERAEKFSGVNAQIINEQNETISNLHKTLAEREKEITELRSKPSPEHLREKLDGYEMFLRDIEDEKHWSPLNVSYIPQQVEIMARQVRIERAALIMTAKSLLKS